MEKELLESKHKKALKLHSGYLREFLRSIRGKLGLEFGIDGNEDWSGQSDFWESPGQKIRIFY
ncbi:hypothetical protein AKJ51_00730 [candidate division MSBL1 archaeon SCGC-AAA382A20]|uniref:Uncharacterized protein n=1 Tax=candidate division MSBL1 archaeon SCGC-AAA382A20 TaxID=1698280 RepID=A0A133VME4_9EURY|nr:hypothetical protein AKJ51_00730 [candidate division MSBL1 archaeon SCGC-AAA382A20]